MSDCNFFLVYFQRALKLNTYNNTEITVQGSIKNGDAIFDLVGIILKRGRRSSGHYICMYVKDGQWYGYDDHRGWQLNNWEDALSSARRKSFRVLGCFYKEKPDDDALLQQAIMMSLGKITHNFILRL